MLRLGRVLNRFRLGRFILGRVVTDKQFVALTYNDLDDKTFKPTPTFRGGKASGADWLLDE